MTWDGWDRAGLGCASQACVEGAKRVWYLWSQCDGGDVVWCPTCFTQDEITEHEAACPKLNARKRKQAADRLGNPRAPSKKSKMGDWFLFYMLGQNVDSIIFKEVMHELARRLGHQSKDFRGGGDEA